MIENWKVKRDLRRNCWYFCYYFNFIAFFWFEFLEINYKYANRTRHDNQ